MVKVSYITNSTRVKRVSKFYNAVTGAWEGTTYEEVEVK